VALVIVMNALNEFEGAQQIAHADVSALRHFAVALDMLGRKEEAASAWLNLSMTLQARGRCEEARDAYRQTLARNSDCLQALVELGAVYLRLGVPQEALSLLDRAIALDPEHLSAHILLSRAYHLLGDRVRGLQEFAWLTHPRTVQWRGFAQPLWDGSMLNGRTILLWVRPGSGLGDAIQYLRYVPLVKARGAIVVVESHAELVAIVEQMPGVDFVVARGAPLPPFDVHAPLPRLPVVLEGEPWPLPPKVPYISVREALVDRWREQLGPNDGPSVGIVWGGDPRRPDASIRFATLASFAALGRIPGIRLFSLQVGPQAEELSDPPEGLHVRRVPIDLQTPIEETAALILNLDHVVTVDTMVVHLAAALGKPVWMILPFAADWRWLQGDTTQWYPTVRIFRQVRTGDWRGVVERVADALEAQIVAQRLKA
jgi:hypothetical protein